MAFFRSTLAITRSVPAVVRQQRASSAAQSTSMFARRWASDSTRYTTDHEYVRFSPDSSVGIVGITDYAQKALGDVVFVELPQVDAEVAAADPIGAVESVKAASDIYAPVSGVVTEINETLGDRPNLLNKDSEGDGWLCKIKLSDPSEFDALLTAEAYKKHCEGES